MADNIVILDGDGVEATVATDEVASAHRQVVKVAFGADGSVTLVSAASPLPVRFV